MRKKPIKERCQICGSGVYKDGLCFGHYRRKESGEENVTHEINFSVDTLDYSILNDLAENNGFVDANSVAKTLIEKLTRYMMVSQINNLLRGRKI